MDEVLKHALVRQPTPIEWEEDAKAAAAPLPPDEDVAGRRRALTRPTRSIVA